MSEHQKEHRTDEENIAQKAAKQLFKAINEVNEKYKALIEDYVAKNENIDDAQLATLLEMMEAYRDMAEQAILHPVKVARHEGSMLKNQLRLVGNTAKRLIGKEAEPVVQPDPGDRRFSDDAWNDNLLFDTLKQAYLIYAKNMMDLVESLPGSETTTHEQLVFFTRQLVNAMSPSNFILTNPVVLKKTWESKGRNLLDGVRNFFRDYKGNSSALNVSMTDESAFKIGENVATTPGKVVYQNDLMQLIQYEPTTETVYEVPVLIIPPWINKYYILDLTEKNSLVKWIVDQGFTVFMISWVNPGPSLRNKGFDDYMTEGTLAAMDAIEQATGEEKVNAIGYCVGGTLLACTLAWLTRKGKAARVASATCMTTLLDFSDPGDIGVFINEDTIKGIENRLEKTGYYDGRSMAFSFNLLRENDLFWSFFVNNYLKGEKPAPFDLLYWNSDSTNLPARMHAWYLRNMYLENKLIQPDQIELKGEKIDLSKITTPTYFLSAIQDHIAKWKATYRGAKILSGDVRFVLSGSGHIAGVVNPPAANKYGFWTNDDLPETADEWLASARKQAGSWWPDWKAWVERFSGKQVPARTPGEGGLSVLEDAPGTYVKQRISDVITS